MRTGFIENDRKKEEKHEKNNTKVLVVCLMRIQVHFNALITFVSLCFGSCLLVFDVESSEFFVLHE